MKHAVGLVAAFALASATHAQSPAPRTLKMQASWPSTVTAWDNFRFIAERLDKTTGGAIKIDTLTAGQIVPAFEVLDATHKKVLDGAHSIA
jgi:TRAP-type mannitol/chloroaromatic compound transport system substrate-binding protein